LSAQAPRLSADPELAAAERAAIARLGVFRRGLETQQPGTVDFELEAVVREGTLEERLWLGEVKARPGGFEGTVGVQPQVLTGIARGRSLVVANADVVDWSYYDRGKLQGGETRLVLARQKRAAELANARPQCGKPRFADGCAALGDGYRTGRAGEVSLEIARELYERACAGGSAYGCNAAGWASLHGRGGSQDTAAAVDFFARACATGDEHPFACDSRGFALLSGLGGTKRDVPLARKLLSKACDRGIAASCLQLELAKAKRVMSGGKKRELACEVNFAAQVSLCTGERDPEACFLAGSAIETGVCGVPKSKNRSADLLRRAAAFGASWPSAATQGS
jgi:uncharacterized protein YegJ (DUF2314 family)